MTHMSYTWTKYVRRFEIKLQILGEAARVRLWRRVIVFALLFRFETYGTLVTGFGRRQRD
jgi:hypothetical protein